MFPAVFLLIWAKLCQSQWQQLPVLLAPTWRGGLDNLWASYLWVCHFFQLASHWDPPRFRWMRAKAPARVNAHRCLTLSQICLFVRMCALHAWVKISFLSLHNLYKWICWRASSISLFWVCLHGPSAEPQRWYCIIVLICWGHVYTFSSAHVSR